MKRLVYLLFAIANVSAWGFTGHRIIGETTWVLLPDEIKNVINVSGYLDSFNGSMGNASTFADKIKYVQGRGWTRTLHYYNNPANENCSWTLPDKDKRNVINGIQNFTNWYKNTSEDADFHFLMTLHLLQDSFQPLHLTGKERGGLLEQVTLENGKNVTLHAYWDTILVENLVTKFGSIHNVVTELISAKQPSCKPDIDAWTRESFNENCNIVWKLPVNDEYKQTATRIVFELIKRASFASACYFTRIFFQL